MLPENTVGRRYRILTFRGWVLFALITVAAWAFLAWSAARWLVVSAPLQNADAIVVLSGSNAFLQRVGHATVLYRQGISSTIVLTNDGQEGSWSPLEQRNPLFVERSESELLAHGVPRSAITVIPQIVSNTYSEAELLRRYAEENHLRTLLIVTSSYHSRRALGAFRQSFAGSDCEVGIDPVPPDLEGFSTKTWWLRAKGWRMVAMEYPKLVYYWWRYT